MMIVLFCRGLPIESKYEDTDKDLIHATKHSQGTG